MGGLQRPSDPLSQSIQPITKTVAVYGPEKNPRFFIIVTDPAFSQLASSVFFLFPTNHTLKFSWVWLNNVTLKPLSSSYHRRVFRALSNIYDGDVSEKN